MARYVSIGIVLTLLLCFPTTSGRTAECNVLPVPIHLCGSSLIPSTIYAKEDTFPLTLLANVEYSYGYGIAFGDTDHDGANEVAFTGGSQSYRIWEHQGNNTYTLEASGTSDLVTYAMGDLDRDGRSEIIGQTSGYVQVFESIDALSHPSELVWSSPYLSNIGGYTAIGDTDRDGRMEILQSVNGNGSGSGLAVFENTGDNTFALVFNAVLSGPSATGEKLIADLDGDGKLEIALCGSPGWLHIFESPCNDTWVLSHREGTGLYNAYTIVGGRDTDGNGKPEIFVTGDSASVLTTRIYESLGDDSFHRVSTIGIDQGLGPSSAAVCNVDGVGSEEFLLRSGPGIRIFRASATGTWNLIGSTYDFGGGIHPFDLNGNGKPELIREWYTTTRIYEYPRTTTDPSFDSTLQPGELDIVPNPCRAQATLRLAPRSDTAARLAVFDVRGRIVEQRVIESSGAPILWQPRGLPAGVYLVRLENSNGRVIASGRGTVVR